MPLTALYPGSFNPFTRGHEDIARRALTLCDRLIIAVGHNPAKESDANIAGRIDTIAAVFADEPRIEIREYSCLTADFARQVNAAFMIRGIRGAADCEFEQRLADTNLRLFGIETILIPARPELAWISSSTCRELQAFGFDPKDLLPHIHSSK